MRARPVVLGRQRMIEIDFNSCGQCPKARYKFGIDWAQNFRMLINVPRKSIKHGCFRGSHSTASRPLRLIRLRSFRDGPLGFLSPTSHFCTVDKLVLSTAASTA